MVGPHLGTKSSSQKRKGLESLLGAGTRHTLKLRSHWRVPGVSLQPLDKDLIHLSGPGKGTKGGSHRLHPLASH